MEKYIQYSVGDKATMKDKVGTWGYGHAPGEIVTISEVRGLNWYRTKDQNGLEWNTHACDIQNSKSI